MATVLCSVGLLVLFLTCISTQVVQKVEDCASSSSCPAPGGGCVALGDAFILNSCTTLTCTVENNIYGLRGTMRCVTGSGDCKEVGETYDFNTCTTLTCTFSKNYLRFTGDYKCAHGADCYEGGSNKLFGNCQYSCSVTGTIGFVKDDADCE
ncbi:uncharacterized protein LOC124146177 [Haliotis rufescens]|uniref:uncharacterized protein LOC124146177 n=1 Tax=Haliotis rufescens TaxID=6454 RepID=UPI001EB03995|nr:uncharacterized protein LOC124146177 [Haliotis rufescens]